MPTHGVPKPDLKMVSDLEQHLLLMWRDAHREWDTKVSFYNGTNPIWPDSIPEGSRPSYHPGIAAGKVDGAVNTMLATEPKVHVFGRGEGERAEARANTLEPWVTSMFVAANRREVVPFWRQAKQNLVLAGWTIIEGPWVDETKPPEKPEIEPGETGEEFEGRILRWEYERSVWNPIRFSVPPLKSVLVDPLERRVTAAVKRGRWYARDIGRMLANKKSKKYADVETMEWTEPGREYELWNCLELWLPEWHAMIRPWSSNGGDGKLIYVEENAWGFVPFVHSFSGWGHAYGGTGTEPSTQDVGLNVASLSRGILDGELESLKLYAQAMSARHNSAIEAGFPAMGTTKKAAEVEDQRQAGIVEDVEKKDIFWIDTPQLPNWQFLVSDNYKRDIEEGTYSQTVVGEKAEGVSTVGQHALMRKDSNSKFIPLVDQLSSMGTVLAENTLRLVEVLNEEITIDGKTVGPKEIRGNYGVRVTFESTDPILKNQERVMAAAEVAAGLMSRKKFFSVTGEEDPTGEEREIIEDKIMLSPQMMALQAQIAEMGLGITQLQAQLAAMMPQQPAAEQGLVGPDGLPIRSAPQPPGGAGVQPNGSLQEVASVNQGVGNLMRGA